MSFPVGALAAVILSDSDRPKIKVIEAIDRAKIAVVAVILLFIITKTAQINNKLSREFTKILQGNIPHQ